MIYGVANRAQFEPLLWAVALGLVCGVVWDVLRFFRKLIPAGRVRVFVEDVIFFLIWSVLTFFLCYVTNFGQIRGYILLAQMFGFFVWYCLPGRLTLRIADGILRFVRRFVFVPYLRCCCRMSVFLSKLQRKLPKKKQKSRKKQKKCKKNIVKLQKKTCKQKKDIV